MMNSTNIIDQIRQEKLSILDEINLLSNNDIDNKDKNLKINEISFKIENIKKNVHQYSSTMIAYDLRSCNDIIKELETALRKINVPVKSFKFSFDIRKKSTNNNKTNNDINEVDSSTTTKIINQPKIINDLPGFKNRKNETLILNINEINDVKDIIIDSLENCIVKIYGISTSMRIISIDNCKIYTGPIKTSVFIENCYNSQFEIIAQQARIHYTNDCDFYFHISTRTIIENSKNLRFGKYRWSYEQLDDDCKRSDMNLEINNWNCIDDFNCVQQPSPNWSLIH